MKTTLHLLLLTITLTFCSNSAIAQSLNDVKIGGCGAETNGSEQTPEEQKKTIKKLIESEQKQGLVLDVRPFAINQSTGKLLFTRGDGRVSVTNMNPFIYNYRISVAQQELVSTALSDFLKLILPPSLASVVGTQSGEAAGGQQAFPPDGLRQLAELLKKNKPTNCKIDADSCAATTEMFSVFEQIERSIDPKSKEVSPLFDALDKPKISSADFVAYSKALTALQDNQLEIVDTCNKAEELDLKLKPHQFGDYFSSLNTAQQEISRITTLADLLDQLAKAYNGDEHLKSKIVRCGGFNCATQFGIYASGVKAVLGGAGYQAKLNNLRERGEKMQQTFQFTQKLRSASGMFARTFPIPKKFELSQATISVKLEKLQTEENADTAGRTQSGSATSGGASGNGGGGNEGIFGDRFGRFTSPGLQAGKAGDKAKTDDKAANTEAKEGEEKPADPNALAGDINEVVQLGRPRLMLSGGLVFSPLPRRTFKAVKGFVLDAQGNPTGNGDANVVGFDQNSPRRLFPMLFLNSRVLDYGQGSVYFSFGITGKHDDNVDLEYLFGPSFSFLNDRALFTFGAYGGLTQNLVSDVKVGDAIPDSLGDAKFFRKGLTWKPGFSFSYSFSRTKKGEGKTTGSGTGPQPNDLKDEIRIGSVPFSLALGMAFTSLEQRTYDEIAGFARDRQGNLTNGQTLTRIVGVTSSSNYRMTPLALLHTRLTNFGARDFYFTTGVTGKKTDNDFDLEYLLGGSVNIYRRKVFLTFGTFIGKQQVLGGNFFEGAALSKTQNVTIENRYVWKPAISFSYDISRIIPRGNQ